MMEKKQETGIILPKSMHYGSYLKIPELLALQIPHSNPPEHDETLFILIHQVYELWFKQILHELAQVNRALESGIAPLVLKVLERIKAIQRTLITQIDILETMTPSDFARFRSLLNPASGFQSIQFRKVEFIFGLRDRSYLHFYSYDPKACQELEAISTQPTVWDKFLRFLQGRGFSIPQDVLDRDFSEEYKGNEEVQKLIVDFYEETGRDYELYLLCETLFDVDQSFTLWRFRHVSMVERLIGGRMGTGGSSGVAYLEKTLKKKFFPDLWALRNHL